MTSVKYLLAAFFLCLFYRPILAWILRKFDDFVYLVQQNFVVCPRCHKRLKRVYFKCPGCNRVYTDLFPAPTRLFHTTCVCGRRLATTRLLGRTRYEAFCPACMSPLGANASEGQVVAFPIAGGRSAGKTAFLMAGIEELTSTVPDKFGWRPSFPYQDDVFFARKLHRNFMNGIKPDQTHIQVPSAFCIDYRTGFLSESTRLCIYDPSGETFSSDYEKLKKQTYYNFMAGLIFIVDPFALPKLRRAYSKQIQSSEELNASEADPEECLQRLLNRLSTTGREDDFFLRDKKQIPCAVILTKADALDMERYIGDEAIKNFLAKRKGYRYDEAMDQVCRYWIQKWGGYNILAELDDQFGRVRCFSVSSLGKRREGQEGAFEPERVDLPFKWLFETACPRQMNKFGLTLFLLCVVVVPLTSLVVWIIKLANAT